MRRVTFGEFLANAHDVPAVQGMLDGQAACARQCNLYNPPKHYGTQMSASVRAQYIRHYLDCGNLCNVLSVRDCHHVDNFAGCSDSRPFNV